MLRSALREMLVLADSGTWGDEAKLSTGHPILRSSNIQGYKLNIDDVAWRVIPAKDIDKKRLLSGDLLITASSGSPDLIGKCALFEHPGDDRDYYFSNFTLRLRPNQNKILPKFLYYWLISPPARSYLQKINDTTSGLRNLNKNLYLEQKIPIPSLPEQRRIAAILDKADAMRELRRRSIAKLDTLLKAVFLEMFGDPVTNPKGWPIVTVGEAGRVQLGRQRAPKYQSGKFSRPYVRVANVFEDRIDISDLLTMDFDEKDFEQYRLNYGDILLNEGQSTELVGRPAMWRNEVENCCFQNTLVRFQPNLQLTTSEYALELFLNYFRGGQFAKVSSKTSNVAHLGAGRFAAMPFILPPHSLQLQFSSIRQKLQGMRTISFLSLGKMSSLFSSLQQRAFSGQLFTEKAAAAAQQELFAD